MINPGQYWRERKDVATWLGKEGVVVANTTIRTSAAEYEHLVPYDFAVVDFAGEKREFMALSGEKLSVGDRVKLVLRKLEKASPNGLINYGLKLKKV